MEAAPMSESHAETVVPTAHVIMACHNRRDLTISALSAVLRAASEANVHTTFTIFDDGSSDGTAAAITDIDPGARVLRGDGSAFWARSMAAAESDVMEHARFAAADFLLWLNDDVVLDSDALTRTMNTMRVHPASILVGATRDPATGGLTYSGMDRNGIHPLNFAMVPPRHQVIGVETFNGNFVAVPIKVAKQIGGIDGAYSHALADIDYGLRSSRLGIGNMLLPGTIGTCARHPARQMGSLSDEWRRFIAPKGGGNFHSLNRFFRKEAPRMWPVWTAATYAVWWARGLASLLIRKSRRLP